MSRKLSDRILELNRATELNDKEAVHEILSRPLPSVKCDDSGATALHLAATYGHNSLIDALQQYIFIDSVDHYGNTPLLLAVMYNKPSTVQILINKGANIDKQNTLNKWTPLHLAIERENFDIFELLIRNGAGLDEKNIYGDFPLVTALEKEQRDIFKLLVKLKANVNNKNKQNSTVLHKAVEQNDLELVELVADLNVNIQDIKGNTPLHIACARNYSCIVDVLLKKNSNCYITNKNHNTAYEEAMLNKCYNLKQIFEQNGYKIIAEEEISDKNNHKNKESSKISSENDIKEIYCTSSGFEDFKFIRTNQSASDLNRVTESDEEKIKLQKFCRKISHEDQEEIRNISNCKNIDASKTLRTKMKNRDKKSKIKQNESLKDVKIKNNYLTNESKPIPVELKTNDFEEEIKESLKVLPENYENVNEYLLFEAISDCKIEKIKYICTTLHPNLNFNFDDFKGDTFLIRAVKKRSLSIFNVLILYGADVNKGNNYGFAPIHYAVRNNDKKMAKRILEEGGDINKITSTFCSTLKIAVSQNLCDMINFLLKYGCNINFADNFGNTALHTAVCRNDIKIISILCKSGIFVNLKNNQGFTALHTAVNKSYIESVKLLLESNSDLDTKNIFGSTLLDTAAFKGNKEIYSILAEKKSELSTSINTNSITTTTTINNLKQYFDELIANRLVDSSFTEIHKASLTGKLKQLKNLLDNGADINEKTIGGLTPLHLAVKSNHSKLVTYLIIRGAILNSESEYFYTPLFLAVHDGQKKMIMCLLKNGVDPTYKSSNGLTALQVATNQNNTEIIEFLTENINLYLKHRDADVLNSAVFSGNVELIKLLINNGIDVNIKSKYNTTPLQSAVRKNETSVAELLLKNGADVNLESKSKSPLNVAVKCGYIDMIKLLVKYGANVNKSSLKDETPLQVAAMCDNEAVLELLIDLGAQINLVDSKGRSALYHAVKTGNINHVDYLFSKGITICCNLNKDPEKCVEEHLSEKK